MIKSDIKVHHPTADDYIAAIRTASVGSGAETKVRSEKDMHQRRIRRGGVGGGGGGGGGGGYGGCSLPPPPFG